MLQQLEALKLSVIVLRDFFTELMSGEYDLNDPDVQATIVYLAQRIRVLNETLATRRKFEKGERVAWKLFNQPRD